MNRRLRADMRRDRRGTISVIVAVVLVPVIAMAALATDALLWQAQRQRLQAAADTAALSGAVALALGASVATVQTQAKAIAAGAGYPASKVQVNTPPASGPNASASDAVEVIISQTATQFLSNMIGTISGNLTARAVAIGRPTPTCIYLLGGTGLVSAGAVSFTLNCAMLVDSAFSLAGAVSVTATTIDYHSLYTGVGAVSVSPNPQQLGTFPPDPYAGRTPPTVGSCTYTGWSGSSAQPGTYCGGMTFIGSSVTLAPGVYVIDGGSLTGAGNVTITGNGVTLYFTNGAVSALVGGTVLDITAPTSGNTAGIALWFDKNDPSTIAIAGNMTLQIVGAFYAPTSTINLAGTVSSTSCFQIVALSMTAAGVAHFNHNCNGTGVSDPSVIGSGYKLVE